MTKRIAIIGCSFNDYYQDKKSDIPVKTWTEWMLADNPDIQIDNYAQGGLNLTYVEFVLRYIIKFRPNYYHAVMFDAPPLKRSWFPTSYFNNITIEDPESWFTSNQVLENYNVMRTNVASIFGNGNTIKAHMYEDKVALSATTELKKIMGNHEAGIKIPNLLIFDTIENYYCKAIPNLLYWTHEVSHLHNYEDKKILSRFPNIRGNLSNTKKFVLEYFLDKYGEQYVAEHLMNDTAHFTTLGGQLMYEEYLLPNQNVQRILKH